MKLIKGSNFKVEISDIGIDGYSDNLSYNVSIFSLLDKNGIYYEDGSWKISGGSVDFGYDGMYNSPTYGSWKISGGSVVFN